MENSKPTLADLVLVEVHRAWTRQLVTLAGPLTAQPMGLVVGKVSASGKYVPLAPGASNGSQIAAGVLIEDLPTSPADVKRVALLRGAVVNQAALVWPAGITDPQKTAAVAQLEAAGVLARDVL